MINLDYNIQSIEERKKLIEKIIADVGEENLRPSDLEKMANYLIFAPENRQKKEIISKGRLNTLRKREVYLKDNNFDIIIEEDKNKIATPHITITKKDLKTIEPLRQLYEAIQQTEKIYQKTKNKKLKKMLIEMRKDQYLIKAAYCKPIFFLQPLKSSTVFNFDEDTWYYTKEGDIKEVSENRIDFSKPSHIAAFIHFYSKLKQNSANDVNSDIKWMLLDLEKLIDEALAENKIFYDIVIMKIDGKSNYDIKNYLKEKYDKNYTIEYISYLYRNKIPQIIAFHYKKTWTEWFYTYKAKGNWKKCNRCGQIKLAHNYYFPKNISAKDGFYTICKECRRVKTKKKGEYNNEQN